MNYQPLGEFFDLLQAATADGSDPAAVLGSIATALNSTNAVNISSSAANSTAPAASGNATAAADTPAGKKAAKAKAARQKLFIEIAAKFVNAMWITQFVQILLTGYQQYYRTVAYYNAVNPTTTANKEKYTKSAAYNSYMYSGYMLLVWGVWGSSVYTANRFLATPLTVQLAVVTAQLNGIVGLILIALSLWKTFGRPNCSSKSGYFQCWYDSSPTDYQKWYNGVYTGQSRTSYMLALQMFLLSKGTLAVLDDELKFKKRKEEAAAEAKADDAAAATATADASTETADAAKANSTASVTVTVDKTGTSLHPDAQSFETVDGKNGKLVTKNGDVYMVKDGKLVTKNGKPYGKKETRSEEKELEKEQKERDAFAEKEEACTGWFCL